MNELDESVQKLFQLLPNRFILERAAFIESSLGAGDEQASPEIRPCAQRAQNGKPGILTQNCSKASLTRAHHGDRLAAEDAFDIRCRPRKPVDGVLQTPGIELLYSGVAKSKPLPSAIVCFSS